MLKADVTLWLIAAQLFCGVAFSFSLKGSSVWQSRRGLEASLSILSMKRVDSDSTMLKETTSAQLKSSSRKATSQLQKCQQMSAPIATSFVPSTYRPVPFLTNCHLQTIGGVFFRDIEDCAYVTDVASTVRAVVGRALRGQSENATNDTHEWFWDERQRIDTPDGDFYHVDYKYGNNSEGTIVLLHGLQSNSNSSLSIDLAKAYHHKLGMDVACMNFRGCSGVPNDKIGGYHLGFTDDLIHFLSALKSNGQSSPEKPVYISGVSLGGNVVLKALGEVGEDALTHNVHGAAVAGVPFDHERNCRFQNSNVFTRNVYIKNFVRSLQDRTEKQWELHCNGDEDTDAFDYYRAMAATTNYEWEDAVIAPIYGFDDYLDYYRETSSIRFLDYISVPTLVVSAEDDPLFDPLVYPLDKSVEGGGSAPLKMVRTKHGGHLGYIFHESEQTDGERVGSWMPSELARFVQHVHEHPDSYRR